MTAGAGRDLPRASPCPVCSKRWEELLQTALRGRRKRQASLFPEALGSSPRIRCLSSPLWISPITILALYTQGFEIPAIYRQCS